MKYISEIVGDNGIEGNVFSDKIIRARLAHCGRTNRWIDLYDKRYNPIIRIYYESADNFQVWKSLMRHYYKSDRVHIIDMFYKEGGETRNVSDDYNEECKWAYMEAVVARVYR